MAEEQEEVEDLEPETEGDSEIMGSDPPEGQWVNGEFVTTDELRSGYMRNSSFTQKSQQLSDDRKSFDQQKELADQTAADAKARLDLAEKKEAAIEKDKSWYASNPVEEWAKYQPEIDKVNSSGGSSVNSAPAPTPPIDDAANQKLDRIIARQEEDDTRERRRKIEAEVDATLAEVSRLQKTDFPLADPDLVNNKIEAHQALNGGRLPSKAEVRQMAAEIHGKFVKAKAPVPAGVETESSASDITPSGSQIQLGEKHSEINLKTDPDQAERALKDFMSAKLDAQEN